jgi:hypothetical protein
MAPSYPSTVVALGHAAVRSERGAEQASMVSQIRQSAASAAVMRICLVFPGVVERGPSVTSHRHLRTGWWFVAVVVLAVIALAGSSGGAAAQQPSATAQKEQKYVETAVLKAINGPACVRENLPATSSGAPPASLRPDRSSGTTSACTSTTYGSPAQRLAVTTMCTSPRAPRGSCRPPT